jgi:hypothetical protein
MEWPHMAERQEFIDRVKGAEREFCVVASAVTHYRRGIQSKQVQLPQKTSPRDLRSATEMVESTYLIRMWAEFETALRSYRRHITRDPDDHVSTSTLIDWTAGVKQGRAISQETRDQVHKVREYRNQLVHERDELSQLDEISIDVARTRLNKLLHCLPVEW